MVIGQMGFQQCERLLRRIRSFEETNVARRDRPSVAQRVQAQYAIVAPQGSWTVV